MSRFWILHKGRTVGYEEEVKKGYRPIVRKMKDGGRRWIGAGILLGEKKEEGRKQERGELGRCKDTEERMKKRENRILNDARRGDYQRNCVKTA